MDDPLQELKVVEEGRPHVQSAHPPGSDQKQWSGGPQGVREHSMGLGHLLHRGIRLQEGSEI